jgi:drug/metabolite transporter (DMT)-like permease
VSATSGNDPTGQRASFDSSAAAAGSSASSAAQHVTAGALIPIAIVTLLWGCNWPVLKMGVPEIAPLTFRALSLPFAAVGLLAIAWAAGDSIRLPRRMWGKVAMLALFNCTGWNGLLLFGLQQLPAGRAVILAFTMPVWSALFSLMLLHEPLSRRKIAGLLLGMLGMGLLLADDVRHLGRTPVAALLILGASVSWALGIVLIRKWKLPLSQTVVSGWMLLTGWVPLALLAPFFGPVALHDVSGGAWFALLYNIFLAGTLAHWAFYRLARALPVAVSSMSSLPVPIVGVLSGMLLLGERPGMSEWVALLLVVAAMFAVLRAPKPSSVPSAPDN